MATLKQKFISFLKQGISPRQLAIAVSLGIVLGIIPLLGSTSLLCLGAAFCFRLNIPAIQAVNYLIYPLQLILYIPFLKAGAYLAGQSFDYSFSEITAMLSTDLWKTINQFFMINLHALALWFPIALLLYFLLYFSLQKTFINLSKVVQKDSNASAS